MTLHLGDCLEVLRTLPAGSVDAVVTDPPYGMCMNGDGTRFRGGHRLRFGNGGPVWPKISGDDKPFDPSPWLGFPKVILWGSNHFGSRLPVGTTLVWVKRNEHRYGTFLSDAEIGWMKGGHGVYLHKRISSTVRIHPNQKPVSLMSWCIGRLKLKPGATILDPYMGSGTTGLAAAELGFNFVGIESDPHYFSIAKGRLTEATEPWHSISTR